jgi:hypothetical protein
MTRLTTDNSQLTTERRALRRAVARAVLGVATVAFASPFAVSAQATAKAATQSKKEFPSYLLVPLVNYGAPLEAAAGASLLIPTKPWHCEDGICGAPGIEVQALAGLGGWRIAGGPAAVVPGFGLDLLATVTRTRSAPRRASPDSTYVGAEASFAFPVSMVRKSVVSLRPSFGFGTRVQGTGNDSNHTTYMWSIGAAFLLPNF